MNEKAGETLTIENERAGYVMMRFPTWIPTVLPLAGVVVAGIVGYTNLERDVAESGRAIVALDTREQAKWSEHAEYHREKSTENAAAFGRIETRVSAIEAVAPKTDQLTYRVGAVEQQSTATTTALQDLQQTVNSQAGDIKLILDILRRQEEAKGGGPPTSGRR